jgi:mono/diheme cytochrome c family protein
MNRLSPVFLLVPLLFFSGCGGDKDAPLDPMVDKGIGPIKKLTLGPIDEAMVAKGKEIFELKCTACHKVEKRFIGPSPTGVLDRRTPEWIMNMILNPELMVKENANARQLLMEYTAPMANQNLTEEEARAVLEYFRTLK